MGRSGTRQQDYVKQIAYRADITYEEENETLATISFQNLFRLYKKLAPFTDPRRATLPPRLDASPALTARC